MELPEFERFKLQTVGVEKSKNASCHLLDIHRRLWMQLAIMLSYFYFIIHKINQNSLINQIHASSGSS